MTNHKTHVLLADARLARLIELTLRGSACHAAELSRLVYEGDQHEHHRPAMLDKRSAHHQAAIGHEAEENRHRFVKLIADWVAKELLTCEQLTVFAPAKMLGALRATPIKLHTGKVDYCEGEFNPLTDAQLAAHDRFQRLLHAPANP